ncbi:MAG: bifunctional glutamate N-acetyltransferase/amino-acid acetyltransferase ArgJ [Rhizobiaceae bacterium]
MSDPVSPLAPKSYPELPQIDGVLLGSVEAGIKYSGRRDLAVIYFERPANVAGVFTQSKCPSAPVEWCRKHLDRGSARCVVINSGNANAFTGQKGVEAVTLTAKFAADVFNCAAEDVYLASTGVIGEPMDASDFATHLQAAKSDARLDGWHQCAETIMTTDTYPKLASQTFEADGKTYHINGIAKGSGMIAPDMATMLSFIVTDFPIETSKMQSLLKAAVGPSFNSITVDSDTSTSDTVLLFSVGGGEEVDTAPFETALNTVCHDLAMAVIRDGEGISKQVEINVSGAVSDESARRIAFSIANSPLMKTAIAGRDANWGRIVMAVGKAGEPAERDKLAISFGDILVAKDGERVENYSEEAASDVMHQETIPITVDLGLGSGTARVWTCDLTKEYVAINGDYRS